MSQLEKALRSLDPANAEHWTSDGHPRVGAVSEILGGVQVTREEITAAAPGLMRATAGAAASAEGEQPAAGEGAETPTDPSAEGDQPKASEDESETAPRVTVEDVRGLSLQEVANDHALLVQLRDDCSSLYEDMAHDAEQLKANMKLLNGKLEVMDMLIARHESKMPKKDSSISDYIRSQNEARAARAAKRDAFLKGSGATAKDVAEALRPASKLDAAMAGRRANPAAKRPQYPTGG